MFYIDEMFAFPDEFHQGVGLREERKKIMTVVRVMDDIEGELCVVATEKDKDLFLSCIKEAKIKANLAYKSGENWSDVFHSELEELYKWSYITLEIEEA